MATPALLPASIPTFTETNFSHSVEYELKEKPFSISGDSFKITRVDTNEQPFIVKGNAASLRDSKMLFASDGTALFEMKEKLFSLRDRMYIKNPQTDQTLYTIRKKGFIPYIGTGTLQIWKGEQIEQPPVLEIKGNFLKKNFKIIDRESDQVVACVKKKIFTLAKLLLDKDSYVLTVEPNCDTALMVMLAIALDDQYSD